MTLYAESSAILAWVFGEAPAEQIRQELMRAGRIFTSMLTLVEADRVLIRAQIAARLHEGDVADRRRILARAARHWHLVPMHDEVLDRARRPFPEEPIRTLDAIHIASALVVRSAVPDLTVLTLDDAVRRSCTSLGFEVAPA